MSIHSINVSLLRSWRQTARALEALTDANLSTSESLARFKAATKRWPIDHQAFALARGCELRGKGIRVEALREAA